MYRLQMTARADSSSSSERGVVLRRLHEIGDVGQSDEQIVEALLQGNGRDVEEHGSCKTEQHDDEWAVGWGNASNRANQRSRNDDRDRGEKRGSIIGQKKCHEGKRDAHRR